MVLTSYQYVFAYYAVALTALSTILGPRLLRKRFDDYWTYLLYFVFFFALMLAIPATIIGITDGARALAHLGVGFGDWRRGLLTVGVGLPAVTALLTVVARTPAMRDYYPLARSACDNPRKFLAYELVYVVLYYPSWEFTFRGLLLFSLVQQTGVVVAISVQTTVSTVLHIGTPDAEIWGALIGGVAYGLAALWTGSILYVLVIHAYMGVLHDWLQYRHVQRTARPILQASDGS